MDNAKVVFTQGEQEISVDFVFNQETGALDYKVNDDKFNKDAGDDGKLALWFANLFMNTLSAVMQESEELQEPVVDASEAPETPEA